MNGQMDPPWAMPAYKRILRGCKRAVGVEQVQMDPSPALCCLLPSASQEARKLCNSSQKAGPFVKHGAREGRCPGKGRQWQPGSTNKSADPGHSQHRVAFTGVLPFVLFILIPGDLIEPWLSFIIVSLGRETSSAFSLEKMG